jgi:hypothetical protein
MRERKKKRVFMMIFHNLKWQVTQIIYEWNLSFEKCFVKMTEKCLEILQRHQQHCSVFLHSCQLSTAWAGVFFFSHTELRLEPSSTLPAALSFWLDKSSACFPPALLWHARCDHVLFLLAFASKWLIWAGPSAQPSPPLKKVIWVICRPNEWDWAWAQPIYVGLGLKPNSAIHVDGPSSNPYLKACLTRPVFSLINKALFDFLEGVCETRH